MIQVLGIDPGLTTGLVRLVVDDEYITTIIDAQQLSVEDTYEYIVDLLWSEHPPRLVGMERFTITQRTVKLSRQSDAQDVIGAVKAFIFLRPYGVELQTGVALPDDDVIRLSMHSPADAKNVWNDERLKKHGLYDQAPGHAKDALRHALLAMDRSPHF